MPKIDRPTAAPPSPTRPARAARGAARRRPPSAPVGVPAGPRRPRGTGRKIRWGKIVAAPAGGLARLPDRRPAVGLEQDRQGRRRTRRGPPGRAARFDVPPGRLRQPQGPLDGGEQAARHRWRRRRRAAHRHDHAAAHRRRARACCSRSPATRSSTIPGHGTTKINAAFALGGPKLLVRTIEQNTGVRVDHYVEIGFGGFVNSVDAVGGITICPTQRMIDRRANLRHQEGLPGGRRRARARLRPVPPRQQVRRHRPCPPPARGRQRDRLGGEVAVDLHQPDPLLPRQQGGHVLPGDQQGHRSDRAREVRRWR